MEDEAQAKILQLLEKILATIVSRRIRTPHRTVRALNNEKVAPAIAGATLYAGVTRCRKLTLLKQLPRLRLEGRVGICDSPIEEFGLRHVAYHKILRTNSRSLWDVAASRFLGLCHHRSPDFLEIVGCHYLRRPVLTVCKAAFAMISQRAASLWLPLTAFGLVVALLLASLSSEPGHS
jgi:hypothetical protein